ncbi:MAG: glycogen/starch/alpha-glucan phosphorylase, partial [Deltaproteobacteria bacterium]|nr:glycogen/starch/alpha-glucan phosphorylase [Deltaproteobacteria bacterium]
MTKMENTVRGGTDLAHVKMAILDNLECVLGKFPEVATPNDWYMAVAHTVRDRLVGRWTETAHDYFHKASRTVAYLSAEFLPGPHLENNLVNMQIRDVFAQALAELGQDLDALIRQEEEPPLGNGGLGRLAACFMDSLATLDVPAIGYGIRYEFGIFDQAIRDGWQVECTDKWLRHGNPWEIPRPDIFFEVKFGGRTEGYRDSEGQYRVNWLPGHAVRGIAYDTPVMGYGTSTATFLRLFKAEATESFDFQAFNTGDYYGAVHEKVVSENLTKVLYPNDEPAAGKELRLMQQYFFVSCALRDMIRIMQQRGRSVGGFHEKYAVQLNDTHPAIAVSELMRLLVDEYGMDWDPAFDVVRNTFGYTNHTLLPEALEKWPVPLFARLLPRHLEIIYELNRRFLDEVRQRFPGDDARVGRMSLIDEGGERYVRMAHLACVGSHSVNGVAALHTDLLKSSVLSDFHDLWPERFSNKTNGVTQRRFLKLCNPGLAALISQQIGDGWVRDLEQLRGIEHLADNAAFLDAWRRVKRANKAALAARVRQVTDIVVNPDSLFDIQAKRIHEYKRQHLNVLHILDLYLRLRRGEDIGPPRTFIFAGKAAPGYFMAKLIIKLIHSVGHVINHDPQVKGRLKVVFFPDFNVGNGQVIYPAADLSEQISTAGKEASGTGNMKFSLNGALTVGTLDGANVEIRDAVGADNFFP